MTESMLETAIEIEGLLRIIKDGKPLPETYRMLTAKTTSLADMASKLKQSEEDDKSSVFSLQSSETTDDTVASETSEVTDTSEDLVISETSEAPETPEVSDGPENSDDEIMFNLDLEENPKVEEQKESTVIVKKKDSRLRAAFSINDRFLYARELFDGNMKMFDSTLDFLEGIKEYSIIEDYFYNELEWDPENRHVTTFMEILRPHFQD